MEFRVQPDIRLYPDCTNFYDELWVCFADDTVVYFDGGSFGVELYEPNEQISIDACQYNSPWHLQYLTQRNRLSRRIYEYTDNPPPTRVYVLDTWIDTAHSEFEGRAWRGAKFAEGRAHGHGTHVGGLINSKTFGVNKNAWVVSVQVLNDQGYGTWQQLIRGLEWISSQPKPGVINISISGTRSEILNNVIAKVTERGWRVVVAAGNMYRDACSYSPSSSPYAVTVAASNLRDQFAMFSNHGSCVDITAPGVDISSLQPDEQYAIMSGTSMAAPIVAGIWSLVPQYSAPQFISFHSLTNGVQDTPPNTSKRLAFVASEGRCATSFWQVFANKIFSS